MNTPAWPSTRWTWLVAAALLAAAAGLRFWALTALPNTAWVDEAWFEVRAREVLQGINVLPTADPVFASGNSPFQMYVTAAVQAAGAPAAYSSRWVSAAAGTLAVAAGGGLLWVLFADWPAEQRRLAALASLAFLTPLFTAVLYSRDGTQNSGCLLWTTFVLLGLERMLGDAALAAARPRLGWALFTGLALAVALTTYEAALALPLVVGAYAGVRALAGGPASRVRVLTLTAVSGLAALLAFAPLLVHYWQHPEVVLTRLTVTQDLSRATGWERLLRPLLGLAQVWWGVVGQGDQLIGQNLVGRPLLDPFLAALLAMGAAASARAVRRSAAAQLLWVAALGLSLPAAVTAHPPAFGRMLPLLPALAGWVVWGTLTLWRWAARIPWRGRLAAGLLAVGYLAAGAWSVHNYFFVWAHDPRLFDARQVGARQVGEWALAQAAVGDVLVSPQSQPLVYYTLRVLLEGTPAQTWDAAPECFPYAHARPTPTAYGLITALGYDALPLLKAAYPSGVETGQVMHPGGFAYAVFFEVPAGAPAPVPARPLAIGFQNGLRLEGLDAPAQARPGETVAVRLHWAAAGPLPPVTGFVHLGRGRDSQPMIGQSDAPVCAAFSPERWRSGYRYLETRSVTLAADAPPGAYDLRVGVYDPVSGARVAVTAGAARVEDERVIVQAFEVSAP